MSNNHNNLRHFVGMFTTSRHIDASPHHLARTLRDPSVFRASAAHWQRSHPVAICLGTEPYDLGAVTVHCEDTGISERRPLRTRQRSAWNLTAETEDDASILDASRISALALNITLTPLLQPGPIIATRVGLSFHFVREPWWPRDMTTGLAGLAELWLRRLEGQARATA